MTLRVQTAIKAAVQVIDTEIPAVKILVPKRFADVRGVFCETSNRKVLASLGIDLDFVQDNHSISTEQGTVRGLHFQIPPFAQAKLIRCVRGSVLDVAVDIRRNSPTLGRHVAALVSAENWRQVFIPPGFAHGYCTLEPDCEVLYKVHNYYSPAHDRGILWNDPALAIPWPVLASEAKLSDKDTKHPLLKDAPDLF